MAAQWPSAAAPPRSFLYEGETMTKNVFAGTWEIAAENGMNKSIARFPDVCMSPPSPPAGPIPIPYPDTSFSNNLKSASTTVKIGGKGAALAQKSYYKEPVLGDEAATRTFGANVVTHQITGKTYFQAWCMDVKFEGKNVCRHFDITTSNHASGGTTTAPLTSLEILAIMQAQQKLNSDICPCCDEDAHEWQKDPAGGKPKLVTEQSFWQSRIDKIADAGKKKEYQDNLDALLEIKKNQRALPKSQRCPNVHDSQTDGCALHLDISRDVRHIAPPDHKKTPGQPITTAALANHYMLKDDRNKAISKWQAKTGKTYSNTDKLNHMTPRMAAGCNSSSNTVPASEIPTGGDCEKVEKLQSDLENVNGLVWTP